MKSLLKLILVLGIFPFILGAGEIASVSDALKAQDKDNLTLEGKLIKQLDHDKFMFADNTGEIKIEFDDDYFGPKTNISIPEMNVTIRIVAIVDREIIETNELKVMKYEVVK